MAKRQFEDTYKHKGLRKQLVNSLVEKGITDPNVLSAMNTVPRHYFIDTAFDHVAYEERSFPIVDNQTMSQPFTVAFQTQLMQIKPFERILEIGTGSGYQCSVLAEMGAMVFTIERQKALYTTLKESGNPLVAKYKKVKYFYGDGFAGLSQFAPFDKIIITCGAPEIPNALVTQLKIGGVMVIPQDEGNQQRMKRITKISDAQLEEEQFGNFLFVPMLAGKNDNQIK
jgi:protein-L-isoaspartate(D-aspartate) O-methyltransferase